MSHDPLFPPSNDTPRKSGSPAVELIRAKIARAYTHEPNAAQELAEVRTERIVSKHQRYMQELSRSGKSLAEIQTAWHHYYVTLSDPEKHEVWQEFYAANQHASSYQQVFQTQPAPTIERPTFVPGPIPNQQPIIIGTPTPATVQPAQRSAGDKAAARELKRTILNKVSGNGRLTTKHHLQSLGFGLLTGAVALVLFLFTFFNDYIIAPFIQPSRNVSSTPIILSSNTAAADAPPSVTIPKINIQIPINFSLTSYDESIVEDGLKTGAIHYPNTVLPGQNGNGAYFGHSSGNIFNNGKYKFAFTLLHDLTTGDLFYITYNGTTYAYRIFDKAIVPPTQVSVIADTKGKQATATLITCDPPGISTNRLVLWGEQISPDPATNSKPAAPATTGQPAALADNGPSLWSNFVNWVEFWN